MIMRYHEAPIDSTLYRLKPMETTRLYIYLRTKQLVRSTTKSLRERLRTAVMLSLIILYSSLGLRLTKISTWAGLRSSNLPIL